MLLPLAGRRIAYDLLGPDDAPVVCISHSIGSDGGSWAEQVPPLLAAGFSVLRIDMRGHGGSDALPGDYTIRELANDVIDVLDALAIERCHFMGLSIGGMIGQALAIDHRERFLSAMWCDTRPSSPTAAAKDWQERLATIRKANSCAPIADGCMERWFTESFKTQRPGRWKQIHQTVAGTSPGGYIGCAAAVLDFDFVRELPSVRVPLLVVYGNEDPPASTAANRQIAGIVPGAHYEEVAHASHFPNVEQPELFNRIMIDWLATRR